MLEDEPASALVVGKGDGIVPAILADHVASLRTLDIDTALAPGVVGSVAAMPFKDRAFDVVLCAQVLEHLPFDHFGGALGELRRTARRRIILSLPHFGPLVRFELRIPVVRRLGYTLKLPLPLRHRFDDQHQWAIGKRGYGLATVRRIIAGHFRILEEFAPFEHPYHRFFVLAPRIGTR